MKKHTVMFIDDDESFLYLMKRVIKKVENVSECITADNGKEGIERLKIFLDQKNSLPKLVFIDINMPVMNGFEFMDAFNQLKKDFPELEVIHPIVMLTSSDEKKDKSKAKTLNVSRYIIKPQNYKKMIDIITEILDEQ
ncbi:MAG: response regulator [Halobacteriovoraceae bacterium]|nr:response regulator [Halobacteriovoraceae bacterium]